MMRKNDFSKIATSCHGQSLIEVIIAMAIFSLIVVSIVGLVLGGLALLSEGGRFMQAENLASEAIEASRSIFRNDWSKSEISQSAITQSGGQWDFVGENTSEQIGQYTRTINFYPIYRNDFYDIVSSTTPASYLDVHSILMKAYIEWEARNGKTNSVEKMAILSNWSAGDYIQTDWSAGTGQTIMSDYQRYDIDDGNVFASTSVSLKELATSTYATSGTLTSSAIGIDSDEKFLAIEWDEYIPPTCTECTIKIQLKFAPDSGGSPGVWTSQWVGPEGDDGDESDYFTIRQGEIIPSDMMGYRWLKYKILLDGSTSETPFLDEIRLVYKK